MSCHEAIAAMEAINSQTMVEPSLRIWKLESPKSQSPRNSQYRLQDCQPHQLDQTGNTTYELFEFYCKVTLKESYKCESTIVPSPRRLLYTLRK